MSDPEEIVKEMAVPCPCCGKIHKVAVKDAREHAHLTMPCGAVIGSAGVLRRIMDAEERAKDLQGKIYKLK